MPLRNGYDSVLLKKQLTMGRPFWSRVSSALAVRLYNGLLAESGTIPTSRILHELNCLEGYPDGSLSRTKPATQLQGPILGRFMHKHYTSAAFLGANLYNQWFGAYATKKALLANEILKIHPIGAVIEDDQHAWQVAGRIAHTIAVDGYSRLTKRATMTGEWIIYYVHEGQNFYLDLAWHAEQEDERCLYDRLARACAWEFPFAFKE
jgi:hypothetical protein